MECARCQAVNPDGKKYCGDCGLLLDASVTQAVELLRSEVREQIQATLREQLKDQKVVEVETTERIVEKLSSWGKTLVYLVGIPLTLLFAGLSIFGINKLSDLSGMVDTAKEKAQQQMTAEIDKAKLDLKNRVDADAIKAEKEAHESLQAAIVKSRTNLEQNLNSMVAAATKAGLQAVSDKVGALENKVTTVEGEARALREELKTHIPAGNTALRLTFSDFVALQKLAGNTVGEGKPLSREERLQLRNIPLGGGSVSEGDLVQVTGFVLTAHAVATGRQPINANSDFIIYIAQRPDATQFDSIVVKMISANRPRQWNLAELAKLAQTHRRVLVAGQLFYENLHRVNNNPDSALAGQPKRSSLWEVHPITAFSVCQKPENDCDATKPDQWSALGKTAN